jgi:hypothetical protein
MRFRGDVLKDGNVVKSGVEGNYEELQQDGFTDFEGWIVGHLATGSSYRLRLDGGQEFGIMIARTENNNGVIISTFSGNSLAT